MSQLIRPPREFTGRHMLAIMIAFFGVIISVNFTMAWLAGSSWTGLVVKNSYVASQHYNEKLRQAEAQRNRGWKTKLTYQQGVFEFRLTDRNGTPVNFDQLALSVGRPATEVQDRNLVLRRIAPGRYTSKQALKPGLWAIVITGQETDKPFRYERRIHVGAK